MHKFSTAATRSSALTALLSVGLLNVPYSTFARASALAQGFSKFEVSQVRCNAEEARKVAYAIGAPTDHVLEVSGQQPADFDAIARRYATLPEARRTMANKVRALNLMMKMIAT